MGADLLQDRLLWASRREKKASGKQGCVHCQQFPGNAVCAARLLVKFWAVTF